MNWVFSDQAKAWARRQVTGQGDIAANYSMLSADEYAVYGPHIGRPQRILDLACGIGRVSAYLNSQLDYDAEFILADSTEGDPAHKPQYGFDDPTFYNDMAVTAEFCKANGVRNVRTVDVAIESLDIAIDTPDLIISMLGIGFHIPLETIIDELWDISGPQTKLIFGIGGIDDCPRWQTEHDYCDMFGLQVIEQFESRYRTHEGRIVILGEKRE